MGERIALAVLSESQKRSSTEFLFQLQNKKVILENQLKDVWTLFVIWFMSPVCKLSRMLRFYVSVTLTTVPRKKGGGRVSGRFCAKCCKLF